MPLTTYGDHRWTCRAHATARVARASCPGPSDGAQLPRERLPRAEPWSGGSPDPIPNSAVKPHLAESTVAPGRGRTGRSARRGRFSAFRPPWRDGRTCRRRGSDGRPASPLVRGSARRGGRSAPRRGDSGRLPDPRRLPRASLCDKMISTIMIDARQGVFCFKGQTFCQTRTPGFCETRFAGRGGLAWHARGNLRVARVASVA